MNNIDTYLAHYKPKETKQYIKDVISSHNVDFHSIIIETHELTLKEAKNKSPHYISRNWMAETFYGNIIGRFRDYFPEQMKSDSKGRPYLQLEDIKIYFKQLDKHYKPSNIETEHVRALWDQGALALLQGKKHVLYVGYVLEKDDYSQLKGVYGAYPSDFYQRKIDWVIDMNEFVKKIKLPVAAPKSEDISIKPKEIKKQKEG